MCKFCDITGRDNENLVELPYFHEGEQPNTGMRLIRANFKGLVSDELAEEVGEIWNLCSDTTEGSMSTFIYYCPRCGKQLMKYTDASVFDEISSSNSSSVAL